MSMTITDALSYFSYITFLLAVMFVAAVAVSGDDDLSGGGKAA
jgi:hypothetical protein